MKPRRDLTRLYREQPEYVWRPDSWIERADAYLAKHPVIHTLVGGLLLALLLATVLYLALYVPEVTP